MAFDVAALGIDEADPPSDWTLDRLDSLAVLNPEQVTAAYPHSQILYLDIANVSSGNYGQPVEFSLADAPSRARRVVRDNDTILSTVRPGNRAFAFIKSAPDNLVASTGFAVLRPRSVANPRFVYYLATSNPIITYLASIAEEKTAYPSVNPEDIAECTVPVPPRDEQRAIAHILGTLDDKIELNRRMSETLEAMARALFKSWFVDFDPVRAKAEGRDPGLPKPLADLFPARLVDSELGEIPEGWGLAMFADIAELLRDQVNPLDYPDTRFRHFSIPAFDEGQWPKEELGEAIRSQKSRVLPGVVLLSKLNPEIERVWLVDVEGYDQAVCSTEFLVLRPRAPFGRGFAYCTARSPLFRQGVEGLVTGTSKSHQRAEVASVFALPAVRPPTMTTEAFERQAEPLLTRSLGCRSESRTLAALRDALLPKLISGGLRVKDAEKFIGTVV